MLLSLPLFFTSPALCMCVCDYFMTTLEPYQDKSFKRGSDRQLVPLGRLGILKSVVFCVFKYQKIFCY